MIITVASGKGGTGKTTISTSLALANDHEHITFIDCDVEAPNAHIFLSPTIEAKESVNILIPQVDNDLCQASGRCAEVCQYHAIILVGDAPVVFPELCHGCGSCKLNCPNNAIREIPNPIGIIERGFFSNHNRFAHGLLDIGEPMAVPIIRDLKRQFTTGKKDLEIRDSPPGTSCPVVETMLSSQFVLLVTEKTPFGLHDLRLAVQLVNELNIPAGVVINRDGLGDSPIEEFCHEEDLPLLLRIPWDINIARALAQGQPLIEAFPEYRPQFQSLLTNIQELVRRTEKAA